MNKQILVVAAHADDEVLGCGGTIARHVSNGDFVTVIFLADGVSSRTTSSSSAEDERNTAAEKAHAVLGVQSVEYLRFPDNQMDAIPLLQIVQSIEPIIQQISPQIIYTHHIGDLNVDHQIAHKAVMTACRPFPGSSVEEIHAFEVLSSTEWATPNHVPFLPNKFVNISDFLYLKKQAIEEYKLEMREPPHSRSIEHVENLARHRGYSVGVDAAEAFVTIRTVSY